jgi:hypothetical protein
MRFPKLIGFLVCLLLGTSTAACFLTHPPDAQKPERNQARWEPIFFKMINERLAESGIPELRTSQMAGSDFEVLVWVGFGGGIGEDGIILRHSSGQWSGRYVHGISRGPRVVTAVTNLPAPKSGWDAAWQKLTQAGLLTPPTHRPSAATLKSALRTAAPQESGG